MNLSKAHFKVCYKLSLAALLLCVIPQAHAGASNKNGNPYGNGTFFSDSGTFSAVERSSNGFLGVVQFTTASTNTGTNSLTNSGIATVYAEGEQFTGQAFGTVNGSEIAATYFATYSYDVLVPTANYDTNGNLQTVTYSSTPVTDGCSGQFSGTLQNSYPTQYFTGNGTTSIALNQYVNSNNVITISTTNVSYSPTVSGTRWTQ